MALTPDADILRPVVARLSARIEKGAATLFVKIKKVFCGLQDKEGDYI